MSYSKFGFPNLVKSNTPSSNLNPQPLAETSTAQVIQTITSDNPEPITDVNGNKHTTLGTILCRIISQGSMGSQQIAFPKSTSTINIPVKDEIVTLTKTPSPNNNGFIWLYSDPHSTYNGGSINNNKTPISQTISSPKTNISNYKKSELGITNNPQPTTQPQELKETPINPLIQNVGDIIRYGRHGQSLRFGNNSGNPITILRNGQSTSTEPGFVPVSENIKNDLSSLYLTSNQTIKFSLAKEDFTSYSYSTPPKTPSSYNLPQAILWSDRVILNAKSDSVLVSAAKSVNLSSVESINVDSPSTRIYSTDIVLGPSSKNEDGGNPPEPALLGDTTISLIKQLCSSVKYLANIIETSQLFPGGSPVPDAAGNIIGSNASGVVQGILDNLEKTKSKYVKLK
jgi:hypothetical protein